MKCVVLAAGEGKRMHPLTYTQPKVMLPVANKPILEWNMLHAKQAGMKDFIFIVGYKDEAVRSYFKDGSQWDVHIEYVNQGKPQGTGHAVSIVEPFVDEFLVMCGDTIFGSEDIKKVLQKKQSIGIYKVEHPSEYGIVETKDGKLIHIYEKMPQPFTDIINAGIYHFDRTIFTTLKHVDRSIRGEFELTDAINKQTEETPFDIIHINEWRDVVYPWYLLDANTEMLQKIKFTQNGIVDKDAVLTGDVCIGPGTKILPGSYIEGPVIIGENCKIGPNCYIRPYTSIGDHCHVGNASEVKNSIIMAHSNVPHQNYVGDSIIGSNCNLGSGTKIANLRLDKKPISASIDGKRINTKKRKLGVIMGNNVQTGINSMVNVGTVVGNDVFIGPGALVNGEVRPGAKVF
jgi:UDP-N-acetylglucosamine diphosphorylase / glucose-1-phosphate thymidylyltransferase / UDP-N-acetylgalactosamine diphosphorylase / glucosamine-1-phosphate N-acetyltransferase / galactosamine-1-phosphate N-acetyltransferase